MNKKIFTLVSAFLLCTTFMASALDGGTPVQKLGSNPNSANKVYQLGVKFDPASTTDSFFLSVGANGNLYLSKTGTDANLGTSLWCVQVASENQGQNPKFDFTNKTNPYSLVVNDTDTTYTDSLNVSEGYLGGWKFSTTYIDQLEANRPLYTYIPATDSVVALTWKETVAGDTIVGLKKFAANYAGLVTPSVSDSLLFVTLWEAAPKVLTAAEFNAKLGNTDVSPIQLTFNPDKNAGVNYFSENKLKATESDIDSFVYLEINKAVAKRFIYVDTAYQNTTGNMYLAFNLGDTTGVSKLAAAGDSIRNQYKFKLTYFVSNDSLVIQANEARYELQSAPGVYKADRYLLPATTNPDSLIVGLQDLVTSKVVTITENYAYTRISLGYGGCTSTDPNLTSIAADLYTIQNTMGQYLVAPIYTDSVSAGSLFPTWVTLPQNVDPKQLPSFQWIVEKTRTTGDLSTSTLKITNREYEKCIPATALQLYSDKGTTWTIGNATATVKSTGFTAMPTSIKKDSTLGYKYLPENVTKVYTYNFNYLHEFDDSKYLTVTNSNDSLMYVGGMTAFELVPQKLKSTTGYTVNTLTNAVRYGAWSNQVKDLSRLERISYVLKIKDGGKIQNTNKIVRIDSENRYAVSMSYLVNTGDSAIFYLKTNNTKTGKNYYALVDTNAYRNRTVTEFGHVVKGGVDDNNLWLKVQNMRETRTSAFAVEPNDDPLYRRFNTTKEGSAANDVPDTVKFFRVNNPADMLYEDAWSVYSTDANGTYGINFLGVQNNIQFPNANYAMYVDTAFVARPATPGETIDTPKPQYMLGVGVEIVPAGKYCPVHGVNPDCDHAVEVPGYTRARYLYNATDSAKVNFADLSGNPTNIRNSKYIWNTKWERLSFRDAVHMNDRLYVLKPGIGNKFDISNLKAYVLDTIYLNNNLHKDEVFSFRLIDDTDNFFIESEDEARKDNIRNVNGYTFANGTMIAPMNGGWIKIQNGVPVISRGAYENAITEAEIFNVSKTTEAPVSNETIDAATEVSVVAGNGIVTIKNAAGKKVAISNILGKALVNTAITSDDATITVPAGIVIVAIEGEEAVKAIVK